MANERIEFMNIISFAFQWVAELILHCVSDQFNWGFFTSKQIHSDL